MTEKTTRDALNEALRLEMQRDPTVIVLGEDVSGGLGTSGEDDAWGGPMAVTKGLMPEFGRERVLDTPISEMSFIGAAVGAAATGLRPVAELMYVDFLGVCLDQLLNQAAKFRYMFGGKINVPLTIRSMYGAGLRAGAQHSQTLYPLLVHIPGLKVVVPSNPYDAKGLLIEAIRDNNPVFFLEHKAMYDEVADVPDEPYTIPFGEANLTREGKDATVVAIGRMVGLANDAADTLKKEGTHITVIDPRTIAPLDEESILDSVNVTGRLIVVDEANPRCNLATDISALVSQRGFSSLLSGIQMVCPPHTPVPFAPELEDLYLPTENRIIEAVRETLKT
jgi:pyruvate dehydrogenase E1 component beta subunit